MKNLFIGILATWLFFACNNKSDKKADNTDSSNLSPDTTIAVKPEYNFAGHDSINIFIDDLAKAIAANDRKGVTQMTQFPFTDHYNEFLTGNEKVDVSLEDLSAKNALEFLNKFDRLFIPELQQQIKNRNYRGFEKNEHVPDIIAEGEYLIMADAPINKRQYGLAIKKIDGKYKIYRTAFSS
jgi:hypothetical protein